MCLSAALRGNFVIVNSLMPMMPSSIHDWLFGAGFGDCAWAVQQGMPQGAGSPLIVTGALRGRGQLPIGRAQPRYGLPLSWGDPMTAYWLTG